MSLSVIVYCYKNELYLEHCLATLANQTLKEIQWLFVNDGASVENSKKIKTYFPTAQIISLDKSIGIVGAFEIGVRYANTNYCVFQLGWDYNDADRFRFQMELLKQTRSSSIVSLPKFLRGYGLDCSTSEELEKIKKLTEKSYQTINTRSMIPSSWLSCWMFNRNLVSLDRVTQVVKESRDYISRVPKNYAEELIRDSFVSDGFLICGKVLVTLNLRDDIVFFEGKRFDSMKEYDSP